MTYFAALFSGVTIFDEQRRVIHPGQFAQLHAVDILQIVTEADMHIFDGTLWVDKICDGYRSAEGRKQGYRAAG